MANWKSIEKKWDKLDNIFDKISIWITSVAFLAIVVVISFNVISRYMFGKSFNWAEEIAYLCFNWVVFFGVAIVYRYQGLTAIDLLVNRLPEKAKKVVLVFGYFLVTLTNLGLIIWGTEFAIMAWQRKSSFLQIPYFGMTFLFLWQQLCFSCTDWWKVFKRSLNLNKQIKRRIGDVY